MEVGTIFYLHGFYGNGHQVIGDRETRVKTENGSSVVKVETVREFPNTAAGMREAKRWSAEMNVAEGERIRGLSDNAGVV